MNDKVNGKGTLHYAGGDKYVGEWVESRKEGPGELIYACGDRFKGN